MLLERTHTRRPFDSLHTRNHLSWNLNLGAFLWPKLMTRKVLRTLMLLRKPRGERTLQHALEYINTLIKLLLLLLLCCCCCCCVVVVVIIDVDDHDDDDYVPPTYPQRTPNVPPTYPQRTLNVPPSYPQRTLNVPPTYLRRTLNVPSTHPHRTPNVPPTYHRRNWKMWKDNTLFTAFSFSSPCLKLNLSGSGLKLSFVLQKKRKDFAETRISVKMYTNDKHNKQFRTYYVYRFDRDI